MNRGAALTGALLATLRTPATWPLALATFLVRGGLVLVLVPIVVLPTPVGFGNVIAPALASIAFGSISPELVAVSVAAACLVVAWVVLGGWLAGALEVEAAWLIALAPDIRSLASPVERSSAGESLRPADRVRPVESFRPVERGRPAGTARLAARVLAARLLAFIPFAVVLAFGTARIVLTTYHELVSPLDTSTPIVLRVLRATPEVIAALIISWSIGEMIGAIAARRITVAGDGVRRALRGAVATCLRHPLVTLTRFGLPTIVLLAVLIPYSIGAGSAWSAVDISLDGSSDLVSVGAVVLFVVVWLVGLLLIGVVGAWRAAVWTVAEVAREGTFGGSEDRQTGDWRSDRSSATL